MLTTEEIVPRHAADIRKRAIRDYANGNLTKEESETVCDLADNLEQYMLDIKEHDDNS